MILRLESAGEHHRIWWLMIIIPIKMSVLEIPYIFRQTHMELLPSLNVILLMSHPLKAVIRLQSPPPAKSATDVCMNLVQWRKSTEFHSVPPQTHLMLETAAQRHRIFFQISTWKKPPSFHRQLSWVWGSLPNLWARLLLSGDKKRWKFQGIKGAKGSKFTCGVIPLERQATENTDFANFNENISCPWESIQQRMPWGSGHLGWKSYRVQLQIWNLCSNMVQLSDSRYPNPINPIWLIAFPTMVIICYHYVII